MDDFHGLLSWMTFMDDWTLLFLSYFYKLLTNRLMDGWTLLDVKSLLRLKINQIVFEC